MQYWTWFLSIQVAQQILPMMFTKRNKFRSFTEKNPQIFCLFYAFNPFWEKLYQNPVQLFSVIPRGIPLSHSNILQYYVKREKCKVNDVIFPSDCEACAINLGNKNMKISIFTGGTSVRLKNIFTGISRYPTGKHEINRWYHMTLYNFCFAYSFTLLYNVNRWSPIAS